MLFPARIELATFRVWGGRDNHYTTETTLIACAESIVDLCNENAKYMEIKDPWCVHENRPCGS